ncbi:oligoribonuclease [Canibacter zhoujuaniae]|uniref:oligoribonuclease n=1 Tax=Canibacter zhoujuaniae TaxID=2708343 RepID=UPI0014223047|nr:oligoribonuclease [Canibacter zhoujuaniae]
MTNYPSDKIVWIDCEMTGLDVSKDALVEIALIITDFDLQPVAPGLEVVINPGAAALENMNEFVRDMHTKSGLLESIPSGKTLADAEAEVIAYLKKYVSGNRRPLVAGNTIGMDRRFISTYLPNFDALLHYRSIDVSTVKELARRWFPTAFDYSPPKFGGHRALADIAESIQELAYFRRVIFQNSGIDADTAQLKEAQLHTQKAFKELLEDSGVSLQDTRHAETA